jgi:hypothetical protein
MADKPRVKAPKQRASSSNTTSSRRRWAAIGVAVLGVVLGVAAVAALLGLVGGGGTPDAERATSKLEAAGCTVRDFKGVSRKHIADPAARPKEWNSFPPTSGPHYVTPAVYGLYSEPVELARILHGLEHGAAFMLYGSKTPADTADRLREIYDRDPRGLVVAPLPELGDKIALGAWTSDSPGSNQVGTGHLAKCTEVDKGAYEEFLAVYRGRGPEGEQLDLLQPGST